MQGVWWVKALGWKVPITASNTCWGGWVLFVFCLENQDGFCLFTEGKVQSSEGKWTNCVRVHSRLMVLGGEK